MINSIFRGSLSSFIWQSICCCKVSVVYIVVKSVFISTCYFLVFHPVFDALTQSHVPFQKWTWGFRFLLATFCNILLEFPYFRHSHWTPNSLIPVSWCRSNYTFKLVSWVPAYPDVPKFEAYEGTAIPPFKRNSEGSNFLLALKQGPKERGKWPTTRSGIPIWRKPWSSGTDIFHQEKGGRLVRRPTYQQDCDQIPQRVWRWIIIMQI